jgi:hypothetical protein
MVDAMHHYEALAAGYEAAKVAVASAAQAAHAQIDGDLEALEQFTAAPARPPLIPGVPVDAMPAYAPPPSALSSNALIPDTPLVDSPSANASLVFDDAPLWQS